MKPFGKKRGMGRFLLKAAVLCASYAAVFLVTYWLNQSYLARTAATARVVTASRPLLPGEKLEREDLTLADRALFGLGQDYSGDPDALLSGGDWYVGQLGFGAGDVIRESRLMREAPERPGGARIEEYLADGSTRLLALNTDLVLSGGDWLKPGVVADAIVYLGGKTNFGENGESRVLGPADDPFLRGLLIAERKTAAGLNEEDAAASADRDRLPAVVVVVLDAAEEERAKALVRYNEEGRLYFSPTKSPE